MLADFFHQDPNAHGEGFGVQLFNLLNHASQQSILSAPSEVPLATPDSSNDGQTEGFGAAAGEALSSALNGIASNIASLELVASDQFDFAHLDTNSHVTNPQLLQWPTETVLHAPSDVPLATLGIDNLGRGLHDISLGALVTSNADPVSNQASGPFVFNSTFGQNSTSGLETAQTILQADQTVFQTVADVLTQAAQAAPEAVVPIDQTIAPVAGLQPDKPTDFHVHA